MTQPSKPALLLLLGMAGLTACGGASRGARDAEAVLGPAARAVDAPVGRRCHYLNGLEEVPELERVVPWNARGDLDLWGYGREASDTLVVSIRYDLEGFLQWVRIADPERRDPALDELARLLEVAVPAQGSRAWGVRLLVRDDGKPLGVLPAVICEAVQVSSMPTRLPLLSARDRAEVLRNRGRQMHVRVLVDAQGRVVETRLQASSGSYLLDDFALAYARGLAFDPRLHDGFPVDSWVTVDVRVGWR